MGGARLASWAVTGFGPDDERGMLNGYLDWYREVVERKLDGLSMADATRVSTPTGVTLLGLIAHLAWVEQRWFGHYLCGDTPSDADATTSFAVAAGDTVESVVARYRRLSSTRAKSPLRSISTR